VISNVQASVTGTTATITWNTNKASNSFVNYGLSRQQYGIRAKNNLLVTSHSVTLKNMEADKLYHYRVYSRYRNGNYKVSGDMTFTTDSTTNEDLVAYWPMDAGAGTSVEDISGRGNTGVLVNGAQLATGGVKFDGVDDYMNVGKLNIVGNAMAMTGWFKADNLSNCRARDCRIISKATGSAEQDHYFMVSTIKVGSITRLRFRLKTNGMTSTLVAASGNLQENKWVHVAAVYDGKAMRLYKDGVEVGSMAKQGSITTNSGSSLWIGSNPPHATSRPWKGQIGDVGLYDHALTKAEISELARD
jgi:hypothetical protein